MNKKIIAGGSIVLGVVCIVVAVVYWTVNAGSLPSFFPGHEVGSTVIHLKHGVAFLIIGLGLFVFAWFTTGKKS